MVKTVSALAIDHHQFWIRDPGFNLRLYKIVPQENLPVHEQLFAAIMRQDGRAAQELLRQKSDGQWSSVRPDLIKLVEETQFAGLVQERMYACGLAAQLNAALIDPLRPLPFTTEISQMATKEVLIHNQLMLQFARVLSLLGSLSDKLLWIKGAQLCQAVYPIRHYRYFGDLDVVVPTGQLNELYRTLVKVGYNHVPESAFCHQEGVGPTNSDADFILRPSSDWIPASALTMVHTDLPLIDIKMGPIDSGLQAVGLTRMFDQSGTFDCCGRSYRGPSLPDQLLISLFHLRKDSFKPWKTLVDIDLLVRKINASPHLWSQFSQACLEEGMKSAAWTGLGMASERLATPVPPQVIELLQPATRLSKYLCFVGSSQFVWNSSSLAMLLFNAAISEDRVRKLKVLAASWLPPRSFLLDYYAPGARMVTPFTVPICLVLHWLVLTLPAGLVRRTIGQWIWPVTQKRLAGQSTRFEFDPEPTAYSSSSSSTKSPASASSSSSVVT